MKPLMLLNEIMDAVRESRDQVGCWRSLPERDLQAVIKSADSAASRRTKSRGPRSRQAPRPAVVCLPSRRPGAPLVSGPLDFVFQEAAPAADLLPASKSFQKRQKYSNSANTHPKNASDPGKCKASQGEGFATVAGTETSEKKMVLALAGAIAFVGRVDTR